MPKSRAIAHRSVLKPDESVAFWDRVRTSGPWHFHPEYELVVALEGNGTRIVGDSIDTFSPGDVALYGPNLPHAGASSDKARTPFRLLVVHFGKALLGGLLDLPEFVHVRRLLQRASRGLTFERKLQPKIIAKVQSMAEQTGAQRVATLLSILDALASAKGGSEMASSQFRPLQSSAASERLDRLYAFLLQHFRRKIELDEVARVSRMSRAGVCRFLRQHLNKSLSVLVNDIRIGNACKLLQQGTHNASDAAFASGFNNLAHYNRQFLRITGLTPRAYRTKFLGAAHPSAA